jgi:hypothetical protein
MEIVPALSLAKNKVWVFLVTVVSNFFKIFIVTFTVVVVVLPFLFIRIIEFCTLQCLQTNSTRTFDNSTSNMHIWAQR